MTFFKLSMEEHVYFNIKGKSSIIFTSLMGGERNILKNL